MGGQTCAMFRRFPPIFLLYDLSFRKLTLSHLCKNVIATPALPSEEPRLVGCLGKVPDTKRVRPKNPVSDTAVIGRSEVVTDIPRSLARPDECWSDNLALS